MSLHASHVRIRELSAIRCGDSLVRYLIDDATGQVEFQLVPWSLRRSVAKRRSVLDEPEVKTLPVAWQQAPAWMVDPLVQVHLRGDDLPWGFGAGVTMRQGSTTTRLRFVRQRVHETEEQTVITTTLRTRRTSAEATLPHVEATHRVVWQRADRALRVTTTLKNCGRTPVTVEHLSSVNLGGVTPFAADDAPNRLALHRFRSWWSAEGRLTTDSIERLGLERAWQTGHFRVERFGQSGPMPSRAWFPCAAVEDCVAGCTWALKLANPGSWQMELFRRGDTLALSGGQADREMGQWWKTLAGGESFTGCEAHLSVVAGNLDAATARLNDLLRTSWEAQPTAEHEIAPIYNDFCRTWCQPDAQVTKQIATALPSGIGAYVVDDGWQAPHGTPMQQLGDWSVAQDKFPGGLKPTGDLLRRLGMAPGLWFEFEAVTHSNPESWKRTQGQLRRDGALVVTGPRRWWDFRKVDVCEMLLKRVAGAMRAGGFTYLKLDFNDTYGPALDGAESPGEGLRQHLLAVHAFLIRLKREVPGLVLEACSAGGHRLEPSLLAIAATASVSDALECREAPLIAANVQRLVPARQLLCWAVLRPSMGAAEATWTLATSFIGRMCLSGEVEALTPAASRCLQAAVTLYRQARAVIRDGDAQVACHAGPSWRRPTGCQVVLRVSRNGRSALVVCHAWPEPGKKSITMPLPGSGWSVVGSLGDLPAPRCTRGTIDIPIGTANRAAVWLLRR